jgi:hypothetical protein
LGKPQDVLKFDTPNIFLMLVSPSLPLFVKQLVRLAVWEVVEAVAACLNNCLFARVVVLSLVRVGIVVSPLRRLDIR